MLSPAPSEAAVFCAVWPWCKNHAGCRCQQASQPACVVLHAIIGMCKKLLKTPVAWALAVVSSLVLIFVLRMLVCAVSLLKPRWIMSFCQKRQPSSL